MEYKIGEHLLHKTFGTGKIYAILNDTKLMVDFPLYGLKTFSIFNIEKYLKKVV